MSFKFDCVVWTGGNTHSTVVTQIHIDMGYVVEFYRTDWTFINAYTTSIAEQVVNHRWHRKIVMCIDLTITKDYERV